jgi:GDP-4-dehydro-6-deoxy-D-mannose reductase
MSDRVLITGATGFLGRSLVHWLRSSPVKWDLVGACRSPVRGPIPLLRGDLTRWDETLALLKKVRPRIIFNCAGASAGAWPDLYEKHVTATAHLLEAVRALNLPCLKIVIVGSAAEYGAVPASRQPIRETEPARPATPYAVSKSCQTALALSFAPRLPVVLARLFNLVGSGVPLHFAVGHFAASVRRALGRPGLSARVGPLDSVRDFLPLVDAVQALVALAQRGRSGQVYNVCSGEPVRMKDVLTEMIRRAGAPLRVKETRSGSPRTPVRRSVGSPKKIQADTGWRPSTHWRDAISDMLD